MDDIRLVNPTFEDGTEWRMALVVSARTYGLAVPEDATDRLRVTCRTPPGWQRPGDGTVYVSHRHPRADAAASTPRVRTRILEEDGEFWLTSPFGGRIHPVTGERSFHSGIDGALWDGRALVETGICAWNEGVVLAAADGDDTAGTHVSVRHPSGLVTRYFHLEEGSLCVRTGDSVRRGQRLGWMGRTGRATGEHLHFQLERDGIPVDPWPFLANERHPSNEPA